MSWRNKYSDSEQAPQFNQAALFVTRLDVLSGLIDECIRNGDLLAAYRLTERVYTRIHYKMFYTKDKQLFGKTYLEHIEDIENSLNRINGFLVANENLKKLNSGSIDKDIRQLNKLLFGIQWDLDLIMPEKKEYNWEDEVKKSFT